MRINIHDQTNHRLQDVEDMLHALFATIDDKKSMEIILVDLQTMQHINKHYRGLDQPTDVLSFINDAPRSRSLGDVFIAIEQAEMQAVTYGHGIEREIGFLAVHGYLHLKGYHHDTKADEQQMIEAQERLLNQAGLERKMKP